MLRKLIALLVLVTGLAAAGQPAQAVPFEANSVRTAEAGYACAVQQIQRSTPLSVKREGDETQPKACPKPPKIVIVAPTVMLQADRARE